ncbi:gliding motility-associated C-terminal domain-containing protein [Maribacter sp. 2-571]|uniref:Ig-like domain-containing protein n=1 Tax=Maribacter sp. 2-571 TaxID=3417569 RepID=UPI003D357E63
MPNIKTVNTLFGRLFFFIVFSISSQAIVAQCPTLDPGGENQDFCDSDNPRILNLVANDAGGGVVWYTDLVGGTQLSNNIVLQDGVTYYADNTAGTCVVRPSVTVSITGEPPTNVDVAVSRCSSDTNTVSQLSANGTNIEWYSERNGGTLLSGTDPLVSGETYWVQQTEGACTSIRLPTEVTIIDPGEPTGPAEQFYCNDPAAPTTFVVADLNATGTDINWYNSPSSTSPLDPSTPLVNNATYYATQTTFPCESTGRYATIVRIENLPDPGTDDSVDICNDATGTLDLFDELGGTPDTGGVWTGPETTTGGDRGTLDVSLLTPGAFTFTYTIPAANACPEVSATVTINVQEEPDAGDDGVLDICSNQPNVDLFTLLGGTPDGGGAWTGPSGVTNGDRGTINPATALSGTYTYTVSATAPCTTADTATITVTITPAPEAGNNANRAFCENDPALDLFTLLGPSADTGGTWSPALASGTGVFDPSVDNAGDYTYTVPPSATCPEDSAVVTVTVAPQLEAGDDAAVEFCRNDPAADLFASLGTDADAGGSWSPALASGTGVFDPSVDTAGTYTYTVSNGGVCPDDTATVTVGVSIESLAGTNATITVCGSDAAFDLFPLLGGTPNTGGTWTGPSPVTNGDTGTFDPSSNLSGTYTYTVSGTGACIDVNATVEVTVIDPIPSLAPDGQIFCTIDSPVITDLINNVVPENGGTLQVYAAATGGAPLNGTDALVDGNSYFVSETDDPSACEGTERLEVTIQINDPQIPQLSDTEGAFCLIDDPTVADLNAFVVSGDNVIWFDAATNGNQFNETDALASGDYFAIEEDVNGCRSLASPPISITINDNPAPTLNPMGNELCGVERPTIAELEANLTVDNGLSVVWYNVMEAGTALNTTDLLLDNTTYYAATFDPATGCESNERLEITVDLTACDLNVYTLLIPDGFSPNGDGINDVYDLRDVEFLFEDYDIEIYNRYGNLLFKGNNTVAPWDGTSNQPGAAGDNVVPNGVYFYIFNFNRDNIPPQQGRIYLNR